MGRRFTHYQMPSNALTWSGVFGANYYDHWRAWDAASLTLTGSLVNSAASLTGSGRSMVSTGGNKPSVITDATLGLNVFDFDGISEYMQVNASTALYNFLHNGSGGCVIAVYRSTALTTAIGRVISNILTGTTDAGFFIQKGSADKEQQLIANASAAITLNNNTSLVGTTQVHSSVSIFDPNNATTLDKTYNIFDGTTNKANSLTATPSVANANRNLIMGVLPNFIQSFFKGQIAEIIILDTVPTPTQLTQIQTILSQDYATFPI